MSVATISPAKLAEFAREGRKIELIDVRTPVEFREVHLQIARNVPLDQLDPQALMQARNGSSGEPLYFICKSGGRGQQACEKFIQAGFTNVVNVEGGTTACIEAGLPVVRGKKAISLERQVRIAAGLLVLLGAIGCVYAPPGLPRRCRLSSAPAWCLPESPTPAAWACSWPACPGINVARAKMGVVRGRERRPAHETLDCRWRGWRSVGGGAGPPLVGRRRDRALRARTGRLVRQLRTALLCRRVDRPAREAAGHHARASAKPASISTSASARRSRPSTARRKRFAFATWLPDGSMKRATTS